MAYVGFCALFTLKHIVTYESRPEPIVYKHYDLERTYDAGKLGFNRNECCLIIKLLPVILLKACVPLLVSRQAILSRL